MRIGIDIDDTITLTNEYLMELAMEFDRECLKNKGFKDRNAFNYMEMFYWSVLDLDAFWKYAKKKNFYAKVYVKDDAAKYVNKLYEDGNEIIFITKRKGSLGNKLTTKNWLKKNGFKYNKIIMDANKKGPICLDNKIDLFIDNEVDNVKDAMQVCKNCILMGTEYNRDSDLNRLETWKDIYKFIKGA